MKRVLLAVSVLALTSGGAFAQNTYSSPAQSPAMPPSGTSGPSAGAMHSVHHATAHVSAVRVKQAQTALQQEGLYKGKIDGKFGPQTKAALTQFQKANGLKQSAQLDRTTMMKLQQGGEGGGMPAGGPQGGGGMPSGGGGMPSGGGMH